MITPPASLTLDWSHQPSFAREDFLAAPPEPRQAPAVPDQWPNWAGRMLLACRYRASCKKPPCLALAKTAERDCRPRRVARLADKNFELGDQVVRAGARMSRVSPCRGSPFPSCQRSADATVRLAAAHQAKRIAPKHVDLSTTRICHRGLAAPAGHTARNAGYRAADGGSPVQTLQRPSAPGGASRYCLYSVKDRPISGCGAQGRRCTRPRGASPRQAGHARHG